MSKVVIAEARGPITYENSASIKALIDRAFSDMGLAKENPLSEYIQPGNTVLIKPNWVMHKNKNPEAGLECLITQPAVMEPVLDYVIKALAGTGRIIVADAPMQGCDLDALLEESGYNKLFQAYKDKGIQIEVADLRKYKAIAVSRGVQHEPEMIENTVGSVSIDLGSRSLHAQKDDQKPNYKVSDYREKDTAAYHSGSSHIYEVNRLPLMADVIINMPKPKTHRLAGFTGAQKNFVGITYEKACLPHRIEKSVSEGGDAYEKKSVWRKAMRFCDEKRTDASINGKYLEAKLFDIFTKASYVISRVMTGDKKRIGSWYGNDTIWRTAVDLNNIVLHATADGKLHDRPVRKIITIADMIIAGEKAGPVSPSPKKLGLIMMADNNLLFDRAFCDVLGFDEKIFKFFSDEKALRVHGFENASKLEQEYKDSQIYIKAGWRFEPHPEWKGHVENGL